MHEEDAHDCVQSGEEIHGIQWEVRETIVLRSDHDGVELGVGRGRSVECPINDRDVETWEARVKAAVGRVDISVHNEVDVRSGGALRIFRTQAAFDDVGRSRALRKAVHHHAAVDMRRHCRLDCVRAGLDRLITGEIEQPRQFPPRFVGPCRPTRTEDARIPEEETEDAKDSGEWPGFAPSSNSDGRERLARVGRGDKLIHDGLDAGAVQFRAGYPAHQQRGRVGGQLELRRAR